jgi:putative membrane protein
MLKNLRLFLKGMAMGAADVVPGVSGGTIAFITGIYEELIGSISAIDKESFSLLFKGQIGKLWAKINGNFLLVLFAGIFTSIFSLASVFTYLLEYYEIFTWSFFFGLVSASVWMVGKTIEKWNAPGIVAFLIGSVVAYFITEMNAVNGIDAPWYLVLSGALAVCAMILPGISGSFILLLLGAYSTVLEAVANRDITTIALVGIGAISGLLLFSKGLKFIFERYYNTTIALLSGFLLGSLNKLWPWKEPLETFIKHEGTPKEEVVTLSVQNLPPESDWLMALLFALIGSFTVLGIEYAGRKLK